VRGTTRLPAVAAAATAAALLFAACHPRPSGAPAPAGPSPAPVSTAGQPLVRVGVIVDRDSATVSGVGQFRLLDHNGGALAIADPRQPWTVRPGDSGRLLLYREGRGDPLDLPAPVVVEPENPEEDILIDGHRYHGDALLLRGSVGVTVASRLALELYLQSVVALELGFRAPSDRAAVMAQAVAARTYAVHYKGRREALGFDVFATDADQAYAGAESEFPEVTDAVRRTAGQILTFRGQSIQALFHSTCGYATESASEVFQNGDPVPYLRAVSDRFGNGDHDFYCSFSPKFRWREEWDADALSAVFARTLPQLGRSAGTTNGARGPVTDVGRVTDVSIGRTSATGRVTELDVTTTTGRFVVTRSIRDALKAVPDRQLLSTLFQLHVEKDGDRLVRLVASGAGYGHGVGMCQFGAVGRARAGQDYRQILDTYYSGTTLERIY
jgi:stage II sporulation protein D